MAETDEDVAIGLQSCLESIERGQDSLKTALARFPKHADLIKPELETALWVEARKCAFDSRPGFITASRKRVVSRVQDLNHTETKNTVLGLSQLVRSLLQFRFSSRLAFLALLLVALLFGSSSAALAASTALPGDFLYSIKISQERLQLALSLADTRDVVLHTEFLKRRVEEIQSMAQAGRSDHLWVALANYESHLSQALTLVAGLLEKNEPEVESLAGGLHRELTLQAAIFTSLKAQIPAQEEAAFQRALDVTANGLQAMESYGSLQEAPAPVVQVSPSPVLPAELQPVAGSATDRVDLATAITTVPASTVPSEPLHTVAAEEAPSSKPPKDLHARKTPKPANPNRPSPQPTNENRPSEDKTRPGNSQP